MTKTELHVDSDANEIDWDESDYELFIPAKLCVARLRDGAQLSVYRSVTVSETDEIFAPVWALIEGCELIGKYWVKDKRMAGGAGQLRIYQLPTA
ncbi:hypothetical protein [Mycobacterium sp.]|uniref:hypothetical protein n=1 Tax=Mycobacterium sp. TaxID=1785 RepID=UPI003BAB4DC0